MSRYTDFITNRLDEDATIPQPVRAALRTLTSMHDGNPECSGCGRSGDYDEWVMADECEQAATIAQIWATHPDHPEKQEPR